MCISPTLIEGGKLVACRFCWQCRLQNVQSWTGRNLAEAHTSAVSYAVTLTYGRDYDGRSDHIQAVQLMTSDIQKLLKRMRKQGMKVRYLVTGEYGTELGRAHWHGIFHFYGDVLPDWEGEHLEWSQEQWDRVGGIHIPEWSIYGDPLGHVHIKKATYAHTRYALKYLLKDQYDPQRQNVLLMSKKPPLAYEYFMQLADETAEAGLPIPNLMYRFPIRKMDGTQIIETFVLRHTMAQLYLDRYLESWKKYQGKRQRPASELVDVYEEFGQIGDEDALTERRVAALPPENSRFTSDNQVKSEIQENIDLSGVRGFHVWARARAEKRLREEKRKRIKRKQYEQKDKRKQRELGERVRQQAVAAGCERLGITLEQYKRLPRAWQEFVKYRSRDCQSLFDRDRADAPAGSSRGPWGYGKA